MTSHVTFKVFDVLGREAATLVDGTESPGTRSIEWNAAGLPSGIYFGRLVAGTFIGTNKMIIIR